MKIIFDDPLKTIASEMEFPADSELLKESGRMLELGGRIVKYGYPVFAAAALWIWIVFPDLGLPTKEQSLILFFVLLGLSLFLYEVVHELVHLLAVPTRLLRPDTRWFI